MKTGKWIVGVCAIMAICLALTGCRPMTCCVADKQCVELRHYTFADAAHRDTMIDFLAETGIPAWNRLGVSPVGVFKMKDNGLFDLYVMIPHKSIKHVTKIHTQWLADDDVQARKDIVDSPTMRNPVYMRYESNLLLGFDECPRIEIPTELSTRVFQLRIYESHNSNKAKRKIEMFNEGGEIALFRETGLNPVFFGESLVGTKLPNLTYMVGFDDEDAQQKAWDTFVNREEWKRMNSDPYFKDTVSNITNLVLLPAKGSQI